MIIRKAVMDDASILNNYLTLLIQDERKYDANINENFVVNSMYEHYIDDDNCILSVAEDNNIIVGYLYGYIVNDDVTYKIKVAKLDALYVDENYRVKDVASNLIDEFKIWCQNNDVKSIEVNVLSDNVKAKKLYEKHNFKVCKEILTLDI